jgi:hypothetical protein
MPKPLPLRSLSLACVLVCGSCSIGDFYEKDYVLYDSTTPAAQGSAARAEQDALAADPEAPAPAADEDLAASVARIFVLENLRDELDRALAAGVGPGGDLARKRADVERELVWRTAAAGDALPEARAARLARLLGFPVVVR